MQNFDILWGGKWGHWESENLPAICALPVRRFSKNYMMISLSETRKVATGGFMKKVLSVYTHSMTTIYLSLSAQVAISTFFMKSPLYNSGRCGKMLISTIKRVQIACNYDFLTPGGPIYHKLSKFCT